MAGLGRAKLIETKLYTAIIIMLRKPACMILAR